MNSSIESASQNIQAPEVGSDERMQMLPRHFGRDMLTVEYAVYAFMRKLASEYRGGYWTFFELSNGGFAKSIPSVETAFMGLPLSEGSISQLNPDTSVSFRDGEVPYIR